MFKSSEKYFLPLFLILLTVACYERKQIILPTIESSGIVEWDSSRVRFVSMNMDGKMFLENGETVTLDMLRDLMNEKPLKQSHTIQNAKIPIIRSQFATSDGKPAPSTPLIVISADYRTVYQKVWQLMKLHSECGQTNGSFRGENCTAIHYNTLMPTNTNAYHIIRMHKTGSVVHLQNGEIERLPYNVKRYDNSKFHQLIETRQDIPCIIIPDADVRFEQVIQMLSACKSIPYIDRECTHLVAPP